MKINKIILNSLKWQITVQILLSLLATIALSMIPACNKYLIDNVLANNGEGFALLFCIYLFSYAIFLVSTWGSELYVWKCAILFENSLKKECFNKIFSRKYSEFSKQKSDEYLSMLTNNITSIEQDYLQPICALIKSIISVIVYIFVISIYVSPFICIFLVMLSILAVFTPEIYKKKLGKAGKEYVDEAAVYTKKISDLLDGFELVDYNSYKFFSTVNSKYTDFLSKKRLNLGRKKVNSNTISGFTICSIDILIFLLCGVIMNKGNITAGTLLAAITYAQSFTEPIQEILYDVNTLNASKQIVAALDDILGEEREDISPFIPCSVISLNDMQVVYCEKKFCYNADFEVGKKYIIVGESGKGKTTMLNALMGRIPYSGVITLDGISDCLNENSAFYMSQNQHIFRESFFDNSTIFGAYGIYDKKDNKLSSIELYNKICDTDDCSTLSGGEQQIVRYCRMVLQKKKVILLDEPFSSLDVKNKIDLFHLLSESDATIIMITHDTSFSKDDLKLWDIIKIEDICDEQSI